MLTDSQSKTIHRAVSDAIKVGNLCPHSGSYREAMGWCSHYAESSIASNLFADSQRHEVVETAALAFLGFPKETPRAQNYTSSVFTDQIDACDPLWIEKLLVEGAQRYWPTASQILRAILRGIVRAPLEFIATKVLRHHLPEVSATGQNWVDSEAERTAELLAMLLVNGCPCWMQDGLGEDELVAKDRCNHEHSLHAWKGNTPLIHFLHNAAIAADLCLATPDRSACALANGFRHGMLAKAVRVNGSSLMAGRVLLCNCPVAGEILLNDVCSACGRVPAGTKTNYRLWVEGDRTLAECVKCTNEDCCGSHTFSRSKPCPTCGQQHFSQRPTTVWIRVPRTLQSHPACHPTHIDESERHDFVSLVLSKLDPLYRDIGTRLYIHAETLEEIAVALRLPREQVVTLVAELERLLEKTLLH